jgi:hypothetical protein
VNPEIDSEQNIGLTNGIHSLYENAGFNSDSPEYVPTGHRPPMGAGILLISVFFSGVISDYACIDKIQ